VQLERRERKIVFLTIEIKDITKAKCIIIACITMKDITSNSTEHGSNLDKFVIVE
jgi:hypothetical protein